MADPQLLTFLTVLLPAVLLGLVTKRLGFTSIVGYVLAGVLVGPAFHLVDINSPLIVFLSQLGIILVTFQIGLTVKLDFIRQWGTPAGIVLVEIVAVTGMMLLVGTLLDLRFAAVFVLVFMALNTSTAVAFHLMREEGEEVDPSMRGIVFGVGAFEDVLSLIGLAMLPVIALATPVDVTDLVRLVLFIVASIALMLAFGLRFAKDVIHYFGLRDKELLVILSATLVIAYAFIGELIGLSPSLGAFIAGLAASSIIEAEEVRERFLTFTEISALFFFAFVGASLPAVFHLPLVALIVGIALLVIFVKFVSFATSSWLLGARLEDSLQMGLYMLAISEFGIIIAFEGFRRGVISEDIYLVSVVAMVLSTVIAASVRRYRTTLPVRLASLVPRHFRRVVEATTERVRTAFRSDQRELRHLKVAATELLKRGAIITLFAVVIGVLTEAVPPYFGPNAPVVEAVIVVVGALVVLFTVFQTKDALRSLVLFALQAHREKRHGRAANALADLAHVLTIGLTALILILFYSPFLESLVSVFLEAEATKIVILLVIVTLLALLARRIVHRMGRIDDLFKVPESTVPAQGDDWKPPS